MKQTAPSSGWSSLPVYVWYNTKGSISKIAHIKFYQTLDDAIKIGSQDFVVSKHMGYCMVTTLVMPNYVANDLWNDFHLLV